MVNIATTVKGQTSSRPQSAIYSRESESEDLHGKILPHERARTLVQTDNNRDVGRPSKTRSLYDHPPLGPNEEKKREAKKRTSIASPSLEHTSESKGGKSATHQPPATRSSLAKHRLSAPPAAEPSPQIAGIESDLPPETLESATEARLRNLTIDTQSIVSSMRSFSASATSTLRSESGSSRASLSSDDIIYIVSSDSLENSVVSDTSDMRESPDAVNAMIAIDGSSPVSNDVSPASPIVDTKKRENIAREILDSERRYVDSLLLLQTLFLNPLMAAVGTTSEVIPKKIVQSIFSELAGIINVNMELRKQLEARLEEHPWNPVDGCLGDIFLNLAPFLKMYSSYVKNFNTALSVVSEQISKNPAFAQFVTKQNANPDLKGLGFQAYLIMPVQRIPRYKMLVEDLLKHTEVDHPDHSTLQKSLETIAEVAVFVNETIRHHEMMQELIEMQKCIRGLQEDLVTPGRRLIRRGKVQKICRRRHQTRYLILLSDFLIYTSPGILEDQYVFHRKLDLELCQVIDVPDTQDLQHIFQIVSPEKSFAMYADSQQEKEDWIKAIDGAIRELRSNKSTLRSEHGDNWYANEKKKKMHHYSAPVWVPDNCANSCMLCSQEFNIIKRKHHCRACGKVVCHACSSRYFIIPGLDEDRPARACNPCYDRISKEGKLQVVQADQGSESPMTPADANINVPLPRPRQMPRRVRPVSMAPQVWSMLGRNFVEDPSTFRDPVTPQRPGSEIGVANSPLAAARECSLCKDPFSIMKWKYQCSKCDRIVCGGCAPKKPQFDVCDPCHRGIDPSDVVVDEEGGGWSARYVPDDETVEETPAIL
ncbi:uncharacterized protein SPPG_05256 [Spizellomyces punctatus DAOM BR117]|uniref:FYVE, RhoGEF and PH domain-containing protein 4 n=1 Tax=Spizellomyces punctatus (strain DAOM BR117) TaxID=645134 RepID=A0A0L0HGC7_SPIPD|nr:uncharacterized protein SPPG_05256 [Spizellomyces punctatus DAOM BR117]KNC99883.1 hypothetical protein SPPG_05256 [Spizellomyces punctatus DAOM BR117]|eukprot:XP_016607923.1 hypothetical protein SPPG_05256 [Spizellomyces punctatus DAOM BR117]